MNKFGLKSMKTHQDARDRAESLLGFINYND